MNHASFIIGADIGGSHIEAAIVDLDGKLLLEKTHLLNAVNPHGTADAVLATWAQTIQSVRTANPHLETKIGIAMPGPFDYKNGICYMKNVHKYDSLYGLNLKNELANRLSLSSDRILMRNDAEAFLEGEMMAGAGLGFRKAIGLTLGTGLGTAVSCDGVTTDAALGINVPLNAGVAEDYISTRWFIKSYLEKTGKKLTGVHELTLLIAQNPTLQSIFDEFAANLAAFLKFFIEKEQPEGVIIGGNIAHASDFFFPQLKTHLKEYESRIMTRKAVLGAVAPLVGAAYCWKTIPKE
jgi:glucokinase